MLNGDLFVKRLEKLFDYYAISPSSFADSIQVQRSSISHLLSGRNKPSLDFVLKIIEVYPEVDLYWLLNGKGSFPKQEISTKETVVAPTLNLFSNETIAIKKNDIIEKIEEKAEAIPNLQKTISTEIEKIVFFYKNGTFKIFEDILSAGQ